MNSRLSDAFRAFAVPECRETSPLYCCLTDAIASDAEVLEIASQARDGQPVPNLLFASVQYLLIANPAHPLAEYYATCTAEPKDPLDAFPLFKDFVLAHQNEIIELLQTRLVQTNEVRRCACLYPAFMYALRHFAPQPLALLEIGCSAGLNLLWDRYRYAYDDSGKIYGDRESPTLITSEFLGKPSAGLEDSLPYVTHRIGVDLHPIDVSIPAEVDWLRALIWPEQHERRQLLEAAIRQQQGIKLDLRTGDGFADICSIAAEIPTDSLLCIFHTHVANQISLEQGNAFLETIRELARQRDLLHLYNNLPDAHLRLQVFHKGILTRQTLANTDGHGRWLEWLA
ncbi:MAG: DUF2332 domain-containing protein [Gimesia chilikensis]|uniref:DUF2332 domain-containing protein n=1 Tax=Gimesia chilikensis TaxID=2605989 RepID=UPI0037BCF031